jgi:translation initiation factor IF-2
VGNIYGKIKDIRDDKGRRMRRVEPGTPAEILGLEDVPRASDILQAVPDEKTAKAIIEARRRQHVMDSQTATKPLSLEDLNNRIQAGKIKQLEIILKADVQGSIEAIRSSLEKLSGDMVKIKFLLTGTGAINESDVMLASASTSGAIIIGFNVRPDPAGKRAADVAKIDIRFYNIIYNLIDDMKAAMAGMLDPTYHDVTDGYGEVRQVFTVGKTMAFAGLFVTDGKAVRNSQVRVLRNGTVIKDGEVSSLKRFKDDVRDVQTGYECGLGVVDFNDFQLSDTVEFYHREAVKPQLSNN